MACQMRFGQQAQPGDTAGVGKLPPQGLADNLQFQFPNNTAANGLQQFQ